MTQTITQASCDHTEQRTWLYGGLQENAFQCPCGKIFTLAEIGTPRQATVAERFGIWVSDRIARLWLGKSAPDCDAGDYLLPSAGY